MLAGYLCGEVTVIGWTEQPLGAAGTQLNYRTGEALRGCFLLGLSWEGSETWSDVFQTVKDFCPSCQKNSYNFLEVKSIGDKCISRLMLDGGTYRFSCVKVSFLLSIGQILGGTASQDFLLSKEELGWCGVAGKDLTHLGFEGKC